MRACMHVWLVSIVVLMFGVAVFAADEPPNSVQTVWAVERQASAKWAKLKTVELRLGGGDIQGGVELVKGMVLAEQPVQTYRPLAHDAVQIMVRNFAVKEMLSLAVEIETAEVSTAQKAAFLITVADTLIRRRGYTESVLQVCDMLVQLGSSDSEDPQCSRFGTGNTTAEAHLIIACIQRHREEWLIALEHFRAALDIVDPEYPKLHWIVGETARCLYQLGEDDESEQLLEELCAGKHFSPRLTTGVSEHALWRFKHMWADFQRVARGNCTEASAVYRQYLADPPQDAPAQTIESIREKLTDCETGV